MYPIFPDSDLHFLVVYVMLGGVRTSIISDALQSVLSVTLLIIVLAVVRILNEFCMNV
jgi:hypothetical protein